MKPESYLANLIRKRKDLEKGGPGLFRDIKFLSSTGKGQIAEDFIVWLAQQHKMQAEPAPSRIGEYDLIIDGHKIEVKMASEDVDGNFQFNGIRHDTKYDILCVLGIKPEQIYFNLYHISQLKNLPLTPMARRTSTLFKLTRTPALLLPITKFKSAFAAITKSATA